MPSREELNRLATELSKRLADQGRLIEAGWMSYKTLVLPPDAPQVQIDECRFAFMAGSQHLFASIMTVLDPDDEPSDADLNKMDLIHAELEAFAKEMKRRLS